jgi:Tol biopolymer transport system component
LWIAFDSDRIDQDGRDDVVQVYVMPWNGETFGLTQLTVGPGFHGDPAWSPDGTRMAIDADWGDHPAMQGIWTIPSIDADGVTIDDAQRVTAIPPGMEFDSEPQYSPDGQWIAFTRFRSCQFTGHGHQAFNAHNCKSGIFKVRTDGSALKQLTPWGLETSAPDWSPDGTKIVFDSCDSGRHGCKGDVWVMNADGSGRKRLTSNPTVSNAGHDFENVRFEFGNNPVWAPDSSKILYTEWQGSGFPVWLVTINPDGSGRTVVVNGDEFQNKADWGTHP